MEASFQHEISELKRADVINAEKLASLQDENVRLKVKVSQLDEENRKLEAAFATHVKNMDWKYAAPDPPSSSYWEEQGYDYGDEGTTVEDYTRCINEQFFREAKEQTEILRCGRFHIQDEDAPGPYFGDCEASEHAPLIRYDDALLPHWHEFCMSMRQWLLSVRGTIERTHPFCVTINNVELPANVLEMLCETFKPGGLGHVEEFHLTQNEFQGSEGIEFALGIMQSQQKMVALSYDRNPAVDDEDCQRLVNEIVSHPTLSTVYLGGVCRRGINGHDYLVALLRKEMMKGISFENCGIITGGLSGLFDIIKSHPNLDWLRLDGNKLNDQDAIHLADALRYNSTLDLLSLERNEFTQLGEDTLKKAICDDSSLNALADSNHVCTINGVRFTQRIDMLGGEYSGYDYNIYRNQGDWRDDKNIRQKQSRARKIFRLLRKRNKEGTNVKHWEIEVGEDMLKVLPLALAAVQRCGGQKARRIEQNDDNELVMIKDAAELSITYEFLRSLHVAALCGGTARVA